MRTIIIALGLILITSCASKPEDIMAIDYPDAAYASLSCADLSVERSRIADSVLQATGQQRSERKKDQAWGWTGAILFAPALLMMDGNDENAVRLAQLKGQYEALERVTAARRCAAGG